MTQAGRVGGVLTVLAAAVCISVSNIFSPIVYGAGTSVTGLLLARFLAFPLFCAALIALRGHSLRVTPRQRSIALGAGIFYCAGHGSLIGAFAFIPVGLAVLILFTFPFVTLLIEAVLDRRTPAPARLACMGVAFAGLALALGVETGGLDPRGLGLAGFAALSVAIAFVWTGRSLEGVEPTVMTFWMSVAGIGFAVAAAVAIDGFALALSPALAALSLAGAVVAFNAAFLGMFTGVRLIGAAPTSMLMNMEPVFTLALAALILGEALGPTRALGAAMVIGAVIAAQRVARPS